MANLADPKVPGFPAVYQLELTDRVKAGAGGIANRQAEQLVERTVFLKKQIDDIVSGALVAEYADRLKNPRSIAMTGDGNWSVAFDGNGNVSGALTLANSGVAAGGYGMVTVDAKGRVTSGRQMQAADVPALDWSKITSGKPTTLAGYGIADAYTKAEADGKVNGKADRANSLAGYGIADAYTKAEADGKVNGKADRANSLAGYGIADAYTKTEADGKVNGKADRANSLAGYGIADAYTKAETDGKVNGKADRANSLAGYGITDAYTKAEADGKVNGKADRANSLAGYGIKDAALLGGSTSQIFNVAWAVDPQHAVPLAQMEKALSGKADRANSLAGYGIADGVSATTFNEAVSRFSRQSTELAPGLSTVSTMAQLVDGADDTAHVTPKKIRWGFRASFTTNGFIQFPWWLGGYMLQWITGDSQSIGPNTYIVGRKSNWVTSFTGSCLKVIAIPGSIQSIVGVNGFDNEGVTPYLGNLASQGSVTVVPIFLALEIKGGGQKWAGFFLK
ncbi:hypothetical protein [Chromobacterium vaccinii]|uniref:hypothetical protein n=1 Tax=Chromobacterium vaccinii TaxID=1108595 RepID=UPI000E1709B6|nr:hypothetical protein [Chromobacterium vaccinii]SUX53675.1 Uncharacterised protein [Chromobacterium vaccinii]